MLELYTLMSLTARQSDRDSDLPPTFLVSVASKGVRLRVSGLESTLAGSSVSVDFKEVAIRLRGSAGITGGRVFAGEEIVEVAGKFVGGAGLGLFAGVVEAEVGIAEKAGSMATGRRRR